MAIAHPLRQRVLAISTIILLSLAASAPASAAHETEDAAGKSAAHAVLMYIPNRIFDLLDIVRLRVRLGPGLAAGARVTEAADVHVGGYHSMYVGLPGPRARPRLNLPIGVENYAGGEVSVVDLSSEESMNGPHYGALEVGAGAHAAVVGVDFGVDAGEAIDFITGLFFVDVIGDDL